MKTKYLSLVLIFSLISSCIEIEISAPSFPDIMSGLSATEALVGLTITVNLIGFFMAALIYGPLSEAYGRRITMVIGNGILAIGASACVLAPTIEWLLAARFIQGFGVATSAVVVAAIVADIYASHKAAKLYGFMNAIFTTLISISPVLGGFITTAVGWRGNYGFVALICLISWALLFFFLPETKPTRDKLSINKTIKDYRQMLTNPQFLAAAAAPSILYGCAISFAALAPFIYMKEFNLSMLAYTLNQGATAAAFAITSTFSGKITEKLGVKTTLQTALILTTSGCTLMMFPQSATMITISMSIFGAGFALIYPIIFAKNIEMFPNLKGTASSAIMGLRYTLCAAMTGIASYIYNDSPATLGVMLFLSSILVVLLMGYIIAGQRGLYDL